MRALRHTLRLFKHTPCISNNQNTSISELKQNLSPQEKSITSDTTNTDNFQHAKGDFILWCLNISVITSSALFFTIASALKSTEDKNSCIHNNRTLVPGP